jgi:Transcription termination factor nusG
MPAFWGVVRSLPKREVFAAERLRMDHGFEVFLPLIQTKRTAAPLFPGYLFARIVDRWRSINSTIGVLCLVRVGDCPGRCPDHEVPALKAMIDAHGYIKLPEAGARPSGGRSRSERKSWSREDRSAGCSDYTPANRRASASSFCSIFSAVNVLSRSLPILSFRSSGEVVMDRA